MEQRILVTVGPSAISAEAVKYADNLAVENNCDLFILHVIESSPYYPGTREEFDHFMSGISVNSRYATITPHGYPPLEIVSQIKRLKPVHVIMAGHSHNVLERAFLGSTVKYVVHHCGVPVTIYKKSPFPESSAVIIPVDYTSVNKAVILLADKWAGVNNMSLHFVHVNVPVGFYSDWGAETRGPVTDVLKQKREIEFVEQNTRLDKFIHELYLKSGYNLYVREGVIYEEILKLQQELKANFIMMASHSHNILGRMLVGGNSDYVLNHTSGSVYLHQVESPPGNNPLEKSRNHETGSLET